MLVNVGGTIDLNAHIFTPRAFGQPTDTRASSRSASVRSVRLSLCFDLGFAADETPRSLARLLIILGTPISHKSRGGDGFRAHLCSRRRRSFSLPGQK